MIMFPRISKTFIYLQNKKKTLKKYLISKADIKMSKSNSKLSLCIFILFEKNKYF